MELAVLALAAMAAFTGAAVYINLVEHPARRVLLDGPMLAQWQASSKRAERVLWWLAAAGVFLGVLAAIWAGKALFLTGALFSVGTFVATVRYLKPVAGELLAADPDTADAETRARLEHWNLLHASRTGLGFLAVCCFIAGLV